MVVFLVYFSSEIEFLVLLEERFFRTTSFWNFLFSDQLMSNHVVFWHFLMNWRLTLCSRLSERLENTKSVFKVGVCVCRLFF